MWDVLWAAAAWYLCGVVGFLYWWTGDFAVDTRVAAEALVLGVMGPVTVLGGWLIHRVLLVEERRALKPVRILSDDRWRR